MIEGVEWWYDAVELGKVLGRTSVTGGNSWLPDRRSGEEGLNLVLL